MKKTYIVLYSGRKLASTLTTSFQIECLLRTIHKAVTAEFNTPGTMYAFEAV